MKHHIQVERVYEDLRRQPNDYRVLVDRLWPRGLSKDAIDYDLWAKEVAPSTELRKWYGHLPERFMEFSKRYRAELTQSPGSDVVSKLRDTSKIHRLILLTATRDIQHSGATVLLDVITNDDLKTHLDD